MLQGLNGECLAVREICSIVHDVGLRPSASMRVASGALFFGGS